MPLYEVVREIENQCSRNQMRDVFFEEIECEDPETWLRQRLSGKTFELSAETGKNGAVTIFAVVDGITEKFVFTPINEV